MKKVRRLKSKSSTNKKVKNATPLVYNDIKFKSKLEVYCYKKLLEHNIVPGYEEVKFTILDSFEYDNEKIRKMTYTPDFVGPEWVIECKGQMNDAFPLRWKLFKHYLYTNNIRYNLYLPRNQKDINEVVEKITKRMNNE